MGSGEGFLMKVCRPGGLPRCLQRACHNTKKPSKMIPKACQHAPKSSPNPPQMVQNHTRVASWRGTSKKVSPNDNFYFPKYPRSVPKGVPKSQKITKTRSPKIGSKKHRKKLPKSFPKAQKRRPKSHFLEDFGNQKDHWTPKALIRSNLRIP